MLNVKKVLIATWGNPKSWNVAQYKFENENLGENSLFRSSLPIIKEKIDPDKTIIIALDTLSDDGDDYEKVKDNVKNMIEIFVKEELNLSDIDILILPGTGKFKKRDSIKERIFEGNMIDYYYNILHKLSDILYDENEDIDNYEIHLDLTHGINFMPVLTYRAIKELLEILAIRKNVTFYVYNSEPFVQYETNPVLQIHVVEKTKIVPSPPKEILDSCKLISINENIWKNPSNEDKKSFYMKDEIKTCEKTNYKELNSFIGSLINGFPLALITFYPNILEIKDCLSKTIGLYDTYINVSNNDNKLVVKRKLCFKNNFATYVKIYFAAKILNDIIDNKNEVKISDLNNINDSIFAKDIKLNIVIDKEVYKIKERIKNWNETNLDNWKILGSSDVDFRNFVAPAGLEENSIEIKYGHDIYIRYRKNILNTIQKHIEKSVRQKRE